MSVKSTSHRPSEQLGALIILLVLYRAFLAGEYRRESLFPETKFIFPNAPSIPITVNGGMKMPGWYVV